MSIRVDKISMDVNLYKALQQSREEPNDKEEADVIDLCYIDYLHQIIPAEPMK